MLKPLYINSLYTMLCTMYMGVLCCFALFVCLTLLAFFFLPSHLSFKNMYIQCHNIIIMLNTGYQYGRIPWADADITVLVDEKGVPKFCLQELSAKVQLEHQTREFESCSRQLMYIHVHV